MGMSPSEYRERGVCHAGKDGHHAEEHKKIEKRQA
jgi:hypothetical protein